MELPTNNIFVEHAGNEVILLKFDNTTLWNNAVVISTGDPDKYKVQRSISRGIVANLTMTYFEVVHLVLELSTMGAKLTKNFLFKDGLDECIRLGQAEFNRRAEAGEEQYVSARTRMHKDWESLTIERDVEDGEPEVKSEVVSAGITGISSPTGRPYHDV